MSKDVTQVTATGAGDARDAPALVAASLEAYSTTLPLVSDDDLRGLFVF